MQFKLWNWEDSGVIRLLRKEVDSTGRTKKQHVSRDIKKNHNPHDFLRALHGIIQEIITLLKDGLLIMTVIK